MPLDGEKLQQIVRNSRSALAEHFDTVEIICTKRGDNSTSVHEASAGCWYTRMSALREFVRVEDAVRMRERIREIEEEDEETA